MRMRQLIVAGLASGLAMSAAAKSHKKASVPQAFCQGRYVYVETTDGDIFRPAVLPEDRDAVSLVNLRLQEWKRYSLVYDQKTADLVFVLRKGRLASAEGDVRGQVGVGPGQRGAAPNSPEQSPNEMPGAESPDGTNGVGAGAGGNGVGAMGEVGPPDDYLAVYTTMPDATLQGPIWRRTEDGGLDGPSVPLLVQLESAVDKGCQAGASGQTSGK